MLYTLKLPPNPNNWYITGLYLQEGTHTKIRTQKGYNLSLLITFSLLWRKKKDTLNLLVCLEAEMLGSSTRIMLLLLVCIGLLADNRYKVSALRNREFFIRQTQSDKGVQPGEIAKLRSMGSHFTQSLEDQEMLSENRRVLAEVSNNKVNTKETQEQKNKTDDSFQSSKRRVRRGSDPIHNKSQPHSWVSQQQSHTEKGNIL